MWSRPTLEDGHEQAVRYGVVLGWVLTGSHATRQRHVRQVKIIQAEISKRWQRETPWVWQRKHVAWFRQHRSDLRSEATRYCYLLTVRVLARQLEKPWLFSGYIRGRKLFNKRPKTLNTTTLAMCNLMIAHFCNF